MITFFVVFCMYVESKFGRVWVGFQHVSWGSCIFIMHETFSARVCYVVKQVVVKLKEAHFFKQVVSSRTFKKVFRQKNCDFSLNKSLFSSKIVLSAQARCVFKLCFYIHKQAVFLTHSRSSRKEVEFPSKCKFSKDIQNAFFSMYVHLK